MAFPQAMRMNQRVQVSMFAASHPLIFQVQILSLRITNLGSANGSYRNCLALLCAAFCGFNFCGENEI